MTVNLKSMEPYESVAVNCPVTAVSNWGGTPSQAYSFTGTTNEMVYLHPKETDSSTYPQEDIISHSEEETVILITKHGILFFR